MSNYAVMLDYEKDPMGQVIVNVSFDNGNTWYTYNKLVSEFEKLEMIRIFENGHGGLRRFMKSAGITTGEKYDCKWSR